MKASDLRDLSQEDLAKKNLELNKELFNLKFQLHTGHLENTARIAQVKKDIARIKTVMVESKG